MTNGQAADRPPNSESNPTTFWLGLALLVALTLVFLSPILANQFTWLDDDWTIHQNPRFQPVTLTGLLWYWTHADHAIYVPLTNMVWASLAVVSKLPQPDANGFTFDPSVFHAASLAVHLASCCLAYALLGKLFRSWWPAFFGAAIFAIHPLQVEAIAWASGLKDLLAGLFALVYLNVFLTRPLIQDSAWPRAVSLLSRTWYWKLAVILILGMLAKPSMMMTPAIALCLAAFRQPIPWRRIPSLLLVLLLPSLPLMIFAAWSQPAPWAAHVPLWLRPVIAMDALAFYFGKIVWPTALSVDYGRRPATVIQQGWIYYTWLLPVALFTVAFIMRRTRPWHLTGLAIFVAAIAPVSGIKPFDFQLHSTVTDHYVYVAILGISLIVCGELTSLRTSPRRGFALSMAAAIVLLLGGMSFVQARQWRSDADLWLHSVTVNPRGVLAHINLGAALVRTNRSTLPQAILCYQTAVELDPTSLAGRECLSSALLVSGRLEEALPHLEALVELDSTIPSDDPAQDRAYAAGNRITLGDVLLRLNRPAEATARFRDALRLDAENLEVKRALARIEGAAPSSKPAN